MILSKRTLDILELGGKISQGIHFYKGSKIRIMNCMRTLMIEADVDETFPSNCSIHGLTSLVEVLKMMKNSRIEFNNNQLLIWKGNQRLRFKEIEPLYDYVKGQVLIEMEEKDFSFYLFEHKLKLLKENYKLMKNFELQINSCKETNQLLLELYKTKVENNKNLSSTKFSLRNVPKERFLSGLKHFQMSVGNAVDLDKPLLLEHKHKTYPVKDGGYTDQKINFMNLLPDQDYKVYVRQKTPLTNGYCLFESWDSYLKFYVLMNSTSGQFGLGKCLVVNDKDFADEAERIYQLTKEREVDTMTN